MKRTAICILATLALVMSAAAAEQLVDETRPAAKDGGISIELLAGSVEVIGWANPEVRVTGTLGEDVEELDISVRDNHISIEVELPRNARRSLNDAEADLEIYVPENSTVEVETVSADISVRQLAGAIEAESVSGEVEIQGAMRELEVGTVSGDITIRSDAPLNEAEIESVSGNIDLRAPLSSGGDFSFETVSGNIELRLPADTSADFDIDTFSGKIENEFGPTPGRSQNGSPAKSLGFSTGTGGADVQIESFSGRIRLIAD